MVKIAKSFENDKILIVQPNTLTEILKNFLKNYENKILESWDSKENLVFDQVIIPELQVYSNKYNPNYDFSNRISPHLLLECLIDYIPLTSQRVLKTIKNDINKISFVDKKICDYGRTIADSSIGKWDVYICKELETTEQKIVLLHEIGHTFYKVQCIDPRNTIKNEKRDLMETLLTNEAKRFNKKNKIFMKILHKQLISN